MYDTRNADAIAAGLMELTAILNSPRQDDTLLQAAGVKLDRALFPLLMRLNAAGALSIVALAEQAGRDASTISRQIAKLEQLGLIVRAASDADQRLRQAVLTPKGEQLADHIVQMRRHALASMIQNWSDTERDLFPVLLHRLADAIKARGRRIAVNPA